MRILDNPNPVYTFKERVKDWKFDNVFEQNNSYVTIILKNYDKVKKELVENQLFKADSSKKIYVSRSLTKEEYHSLKESYSEILNVVTDIDEADYVVVSDTFFSNNLVRQSSPIGIVTMQDKVLSLANGYKLSAITSTYNPKSIYKKLVKEKHVKDTDKYELVNSNSYCLLKSADTVKVQDIILKKKLPIISYSKFTRDINGENFKINEDDIESLEELLDSPDPDNIDLAFRLIATSNYMEMPYTVRALMAKHNRNISARMNAFTRKKFTIFDDLKLNDVIYGYGGFNLTLSSASDIYKHKFPTSEEDLALSRKLILPRLQECVNNLITPRMRKYLGIGGFNITATIE